MEKVLLKNHFSLLCAQDIHEICKPYLKQYSLAHFNYFRLYKDRSIFYLCNNPDWLSHYYLQNYPTVGAFEQQPELANLRYVLWSALSSRDVILKDTREMFGIHHGITLIKKSKNYHEFYNIGSSNPDASTINFFINHYDTLNKLTLLFQEKADKLIRLSQKQKLILPPHLHNPQMIKSNDKAIYSEEIKQKNNFLTQTESICIKLYLTGKTPLEIANLLNVSKRTVEKHIENIKLKFHCKKQIQLGYALAKAGILID